MKQTKKTQRIGKNRRFTKRGGGWPFSTTPTLQKQTDRIITDKTSIIGGTKLIQFMPRARLTGFRSLGSSIPGLRTKTKQDIKRDIYIAIQDINTISKLNDGTKNTNYRKIYNYPELLVKIYDACKQISGAPEINIADVEPFTTSSVLDNAVSFGFSDVVFLILSAYANPEYAISRLDIQREDGTVNAEKEDIRTLLEMYKEDGSYLLTGTGRFLNGTNNMKTKTFRQTKLMRNAYANTTRKP